MTEMRGFRARALGLISRGWLGGDIPEPILNSAGNAESDVGTELFEEFGRFWPALKL